MLDVIFWTFGIGLLLIGSLLTFANYVILYVQLFRKRTSSFAPLLGGLFICGGMLLLPIAGLWRFAWIGLLIDFGCAPLMTMTLWCHLRHKE